MDEKKGNEHSNVKTHFDAALQKHHLEIIKAAIPYINTSEQKMISIYVKLSELIETISVFQKPESSVGICSADNDGSILDMLNDIKEVGTAKEKETIDMLINYMNAFQLYNTYKSTFKDEDAQEFGGFDTLKQMLTPEQQQMFDTYSCMFSN